MLEKWHSIEQCRLSLHAKRHKTRGPAVSSRLLLSTTSLPDSSSCPNQIKSALLPKLETRTPRASSCQINFSFVHFIISSTCCRITISHPVCSINQKVVPGTNMKSTLSATDAMAKKTVAIVALVMRSFLTYGSLMREKFIHVYSLNPRYAAAMSILYWYEMRK